MKRLLSAILALIVIAFAGYAICLAWSVHLQKKHEAIYQSALYSYSEVLPAGMPRRKVEEYLRSKDIHFQKMCCVAERSAYTDVVQIGHEPATFACREWKTYIAFQFVPEGVDSIGSISEAPSDIVKRVSIYRNGVCL